MDKFISLTLLSLVLFSSCEKTISFRPNDVEQKLVVEATIEDGKAPRVFLTHSQNYFSTVTPEILANYFVHDAKISISNGEKTHLLKEYSVVTGPGLNFYYYSTDSTSMSTVFGGEQGKSYSMTIESAGKTYTSNTTIPVLAKKLDSLWWQPAPDNPDTSLVVLMGRSTDPPGFGNYIRYFTSVNEEAFYPGLNSVFDDQIVDGKTYDIQIEKGVDRNLPIDFENYAFFSHGDSVTVKLCNIDKATYDFWRTIEYSYASIGNPFSSPTRVLGNISGGALGYFGGYSVQYISLKIP
jgi:hypothetical protein